MLTNCFIARSLLAILLLVSVTSCNKDLGLPIEMQEIWDCPHEKEWTLETTINALQGQWELLVSLTYDMVDGDADLLELDVEKSIVGLYGRIQICNDIVFFNNSYRDGGDTYFRKIE